VLPLGATESRPGHQPLPYPSLSFGEYNSNSYSNFTTPV
jgi:hypothetical protein